MRLPPAGEKMTGGKDGARLGVVWLIHPNPYEFPFSNTRHNNISPPSSLVGEPRHPPEADKFCCRVARHRQVG